MYSLLYFGYGCFLSADRFIRRRVRLFHIIRSAGAKQGYAEKTNGHAGAVR